jgi:hypothetical protein
MMFGFIDEFMDVYGWYADEYMKAYGWVQRKYRGYSTPYWL